MTGSRHAWFDATAGVAGDMLVGALIDAGADPVEIHRAVDAVIPDSVELRCTVVTRAGLRAHKIDFEPVITQPPERRWNAIKIMITEAELPGRVRERALRVFTRLAEAEAYVHGIAVDDVHFHEVGALDSIADVVGVCAALELLDVQTVSASAVAVGSGRIRVQHGDLGVPGPAVVRLALGWQVRSGGQGELATPTGMALLVALAERCEELPSLHLETTGVGAGTRDPADRANVTRVMIGTRALPAGRNEPAPNGSMVVLEANVDDFDPRLWPGVLQSLLAADAADAWLVPILMKKGRPAHTLSVLARQDQAPVLRELVLSLTSTIGIRETRVSRTVLDRGWVDVSVGEDRVPVKVAYGGGRIRQVNPEFDEVEVLAARRCDPVATVLQAAVDAARVAGLVAGRPVPDDLRGTRSRPS